jgi:3-hydroxyisobutyrate dehydrogenase-like beta-hydroxyacid dehydrogenase
MGANGQTSVGFLGLGAIGSPIAERLIKGGVSVVLYNRSIENTEHFRGRAMIAATPVEVADKAEIVFGCVSGSEAYRDVILGPAGIIYGKRVKTYVHIGTSDVSLLEEFATRLSTREIAIIDAPMTGGVPRARDGNLTVMAAGPPEVFDRAEPYIKHYASKIIFLGDRVGAAQMMKYVNNVLSASNLALACEALVLGRKAGLDPGAMLEVLNNGTGQNSATMTKIPAQVLTRRFNHGGAIGPMIKDLEAFSTQASRYGVSIPLTEAVIGCFRRAADEVGEREDLTRIICPMERAAEILVEGRHPL